MKIDPHILQPYIDQKLISVRKHPTEELHIYNYTKKAQYEGVWTPELLMCRGLILDHNGTVIARPFDKFFTLDQMNVDIDTLLKSEPFSVWDKTDGSLGILYPTSDGNLQLATRGSFTSYQAVKGTEILQEILQNSPGEFSYDSKYTYLFEIIYPENRIVVSYGKDEKLILLAAREIESGKIFTPSQLPFPHPFEEAQPHTQQDLEKNRDNAEGFVLYFESGKMAKVKYPEYVRLHRLVTGVSEKAIWELLKNNQEFDELVDRVPDEFYQWVKNTKKDLKEQFEKVEKECLVILNKAKKLDNRKDQATFIRGQAPTYSGILFAMLDGKPYQEIIWKLIRPKTEVPFKKEV